MPTAVWSPPTNCPYTVIAIHQVSELSQCTVHAQHHLGGLRPNRDDMCRMVILMLKHHLDGKCDIDLVTRTCVRVIHELTVSRHSWLLVLVILIMLIAWGGPESLHARAITSRRMVSTGNRRRHFLTLKRRLFLLGNRDMLELKPGIRWSPSTNTFYL